MEKIGGIVASWKLRYFVLTKEGLRYFVEANEATIPSKAKVIPALSFCIFCSSVEFSI